jgi:Family of unknown function (DUF6152)
MSFKPVVYLSMLGFMMVSVSLFAHHGTGVSYDMKKTIALKGVITKFVYTNPHAQLYFDVTDDKGNIVHWATEMSNPLNLQALGHSRKELMEKLAPGTSVTVTGSPSKVGSPIVLFGKAVVADGWCLCNDARGGAPDDVAPAAGARPEGR